MVTWIRSSDDVSGQLLAMKLIAFALMVADHVDWFLYGGSLGINATVGRAVFPLFAAVLAYNLARMRLAAFPRMMRRLLWGGALASLPYVYLQGSVVPLNVLATFAAAVGVIWLLRLQSNVSAMALFLAAGLVVDYLWFGLAAIVAAWWFSQRGWRCEILAAAALVVPFNLSAWSLLACVVALATWYCRGDAPRWKWLFYVGYPVHLVAIAAIASIIR